MLRKVALMSCMAGALIFAMACSGDSSKVTKDSGTLTLDGKTQQKDQKVVTKKDTGGTTKKDSGGTTTPPKDCYEIIVCASKCGSDQTCSQKCVSAAPAAAQTKYNAYSTCANTAAKGSCASKCTSATDPNCLPCIDAACKTEKDACYGTGGPATAGFGKKCDPSKSGVCATGLECVALASSTSKMGWCTKTCTGSASPKPCAGGPTGTNPYCLLSDQAKTKYWCAFVCKAGTSTWPCPTDLKCGTPTNNQAICEPK